MDLLTGTLVGLGLVAAVALWGIARRLRGAEPAEAELPALPPGLDRRVPVSLHPVIDPGACIGSAACVTACPEGEILRLHDGFARLVQPESCIGHGACAAACPTEAIRLVFGTRERGVDIPRVSPTFETAVPGLYIAGELGGMGLIRNAVEQGAQAARDIVRRCGEGRDTSQASDDRPLDLDLVIVGAGPAGLSAAVVAQQAGLSFEVIEQEPTIGGTIGHYPRRKIVTLGPLQIPGAAPIHDREMVKEDLVALWRELVEDRALPIAFDERLEGVAAADDLFEVATSRRSLSARFVLLAIGRRGSPNRLGVPGEDMSHVAYALREPEAFEGLSCVVVGGGDSALEAALGLSEVPGTRVTLSYRGDTIFRARPANAERLRAATQGGRITLELKTEVVAIDRAGVQLSRGGERHVISADQVFVFAGGTFPSRLLLDAGVEISRKHGVA